MTSSVHRHAAAARSSDEDLSTGNNNLSEANHNYTLEDVDEEKPNSEEGYFTPGGVRETTQ